MAEQIKIVETKDLKGRLVAIGLIIAALVFGWFSIRWQLGNMLATLTSPNDPNAKEIAEFANSLSPRDPMTNWLKASVEMNIYTPENLAKSVEDFEKMVRYAPEDFRYWVELGRAYEQSEKFEQSEKAFRRAVELAPTYSSPRWHIGNYYLRRGNETEAFTELRKAAESSAVYQEQVFSIVWDYYEKDPAKLEQLAGENSDVRAGLAKFYAGKERAADSLRIWNTLSEEEKQQNQAVAQLIAQALYEKRFYRSAVEFVRQLGIEPQAQAETVQNGGFETPIGEDARSVHFGWKIGKLEKIDVKTDLSKKKEGNRSLRVTFSGFSGIEIKNIAQIVAVEPNKKYRLNFWLKTEDLKSAGAPTLEIVNGNDEKIITTSTAFPGGTNDWSPVKIEFTAPETAQAIVLRIDRAYCGDACPIVGTFWVDDFKLEKIGS